MKKTFKLLAVLLAAIIVILLAVFTVNNVGKSSQTLSPASTQQRRLWNQKTYTSADWVYEPWESSYSAKVHYVRFASDDVEAGTIKKATIKLDARVRESEKTVSLAAISLSDSLASNVESDLTSLTSTNKVTKSANAAKLITDTNGNYLSEPASSVVASKKVTGSETATKKDVFSDDSGDYNYPVEIELDVTDTVRSAFAGGNHVQFVLTSAKDVLTADGENIYDIENFESYSNGAIYDTNGNVIRETENMLNLDTATYVCGDAGYYTSEDIDDEYFSWLYIVRDSIEMEIELQDEDDAYAELKTKTNSAEDFEKNIDSLAYILDEKSFDMYDNMRKESHVNGLLFDALNSCNEISEFKTQFNDITNKEYWQGYDIRLNTETDLGGKRGVITVEGDKIPDVAYALIEVYNSDKLQESYTVNVKEGRGYYNTYGNDRLSVNITLTSDKSGKEPISGTKTITFEDIYLPDIFITEITNFHTRTFYPDEDEYRGETKNHGKDEQNFQYIELCNYNEEPVDLRDYTFVYNDGKEHDFEWIFEEGGNSVINPGEMYVIGVYSSNSALKGYSYSDDASIKEYWKGFNEFYNVNIPAANRVLIACVESGKSDAMLDGMKNLTRTKDAGLTVNAEIRKNGETITKVYMPESKSYYSYAYQFIPSNDIKESFLFCTGCFPYQLLSEQKLDYCEKAYFSNTDAIKVMSYNILYDSEGMHAGTENLSRLPLLYKTIKDYDVDILGMQEVNAEWIAAFKKQELSGYSCIEGLSTFGNNYSGASDGNKELMNPIYYKTDKFTLLHSGEAFLTPDGRMETKQWDSIDMTRTMTWAVLENNETNEIISFINAHLPTSGKQVRVEQVKMLYQKGAELQNKYGGGIVIVGDHNMFETTEPYNAYINSGVVTDSKYQTTNHVSVCTYLDYGIYGKTNASPIDYCFISPNKYIVQKYDVLDGIYPEGTVSDHSAIYVELLDKDNVIFE